MQKFLKSLKNQQNLRGIYGSQKKRDMCEISLSGKKLIEDLSNYGLIQNKTNKFSMKYTNYIKQK